MSATVLDVRNLQVEFPTDSNIIIKAVDGISFNLQRGQTLGIVGESGSGKSVTSLAVMGLVQSPGRISSGEIWFSPHAEAAPVNLCELPGEQMQQYRGGNLAMIFQEPMSSLNPVFTIGFQLTEALQMHRNMTAKEARRQAIALLQEVKLLKSDEELWEEYTATWKQAFAHAAQIDENAIQQTINQHKQSILDRYPHELSGGQLQRVMIAMAISCEPAILIADEPTTALDVTVQATILDLLQELRVRRNMSMIFITHDLSLIAETADTIAVMYKGKIVEAGSVSQIFNNPQHPYTKGLIACRPNLESHPQKLLTVSDFMEVDEASTGEVIIKAKQPSLPLQVTSQQLAQRLEKLQRQQPLLEVRNLYVGFPTQNDTSQSRDARGYTLGRGTTGIAQIVVNTATDLIRQIRPKRYFMAVNGVSFNIYPGETLGLVGESGCGKTTLGRTLLRLVEPLSGEIIFDNQDITTLTGKPLQRLRREMQIIFQNPFSSLDPRMSIGAAVMEPLAIHDAGRNYKQRRKIAAELLERVGIDSRRMNRYPHEFSGGQRQRICIARALALNPKFIICDESVSALDVSVQAQVLNLLKELQDDFKLTYIFISHDLSVVKFMSDRILVMNSGQIVEEGPAENIYRTPKQEYTQQLIASIPTGSPERIRQRQMRTRL